MKQKNDERLQNEKIVKGQNWFNAIVVFILVAVFVTLLVVPSSHHERPKDYPPAVVRIVEFGYNGHDYIEFVFNNNRSVVHNPDCHCFTDSIKNN